MKMQESEINEAFRAEVREWMAQHLTGKFAPLKHAAGLGSEGYDPQLAKEWEQELAKGGWTGLGWEVHTAGAMRRWPSKSSSTRNMCAAAAPVVLAILARRCWRLR